MKLFFQSFVQIALVAANTLFISRLNIPAIFVCSFLISLLWAFNVSKVAISTTRSKLVYAFGAGCGAVTGLLILKFVL